jgi:hypothetical protein
MPLQVSPVGQGVQGAPPVPHAASVLPAMHAPIAQHPPQVAGPHEVPPSLAPWQTPAVHV